MKIAVEAGELMEKFVWAENNAASFKELENNRKEIEDECADILILIAAFANACKIDLASAFMTKLEEAKKKYPIDKAKGRSTKYTKL